MPANISQGYSNATFGKFFAQLFCAFPNNTAQYLMRISYSLVGEKSNKLNL